MIQSHIYMLALIVCANTAWWLMDDVQLLFLFSQ